MRYLIVSDIHANLAAFKAVLNDAKDEWDFIWCLGDLIGYGPDPNECVALLREHKHLSLSGNHDWAVLGRMDLYHFNADARVAIGWTQSVLSDETQEYLEALPPRDRYAPYTLAHASPREPVWEYILDDRTAAENFNYFDTNVCLVGHTHVPVIYEWADNVGVRRHEPHYGQAIPVNTNRLIINPGSVGQPRDNDPRAAYAVLDSEENTWEHRRVAYDIRSTQKRMSQFRLPFRLIDRLEHGW